MRRFVVILNLVFHLSAVPAFAADVLLGTIRSVDREKGEMLVDVLDYDGDAEELPESVTIRVAPEHLAGPIPAGEVVRIWGNFVRGSSHMFDAATIRGRSFHLRGRDPTGVRSRLGRGRGRMPGPMGGGGRRPGRR